MNDDLSGTSSDATPADGVRQRWFVALSQEDGSWSWRERWFANDFTGGVYNLHVQVGDVDGDGDDDVVTFDDDFEAQDPLGRVLLAEDDRFVEGDLPDPETNLTFTTNRWLADVDGDGAAELVMTNTADEAEVFDLEDGDWVRKNWVVEGSPADNAPAEVVVVDLEGDGDDDLVWGGLDEEFERIDEVNVLISGESGFTAERRPATGLTSSEALLYLTGNVRS